MNDLKNILLKQDLIYNRILQQKNSVEWSYPYININNILDGPNQIFTWSDYTIQSDKDFNIFINKRLLIDRRDEKVKVFLYVLPFHFGINNIDNGIYYINQYEKIEKDKNLPESVIYKNAKGSVDDNFTQNDYIFFAHFGIKNYLTYRKEDKIIFKWTNLYENKETIEQDSFGKQGSYYIDWFSNPSYFYEKANITAENLIDFKDILNRSCQIENSENSNQYTCYFTGMPLQEQLFDNGSQVIGDIYLKKEEEMYQLDGQGGRTDHLTYNTPAGLTLRLY